MKFLNVLLMAPAVTALVIEPRHHAGKKTTAAAGGKKGGKGGKAMAGAAAAGAAAAGAGAAACKQARDIAERDPHHAVSLQALLTSPTTRHNTPLLTGPGD